MRAIFTTSPALGSALIRAREGGTASHVGLVVGDRVIDATWTHGGVRAWWLDQWVTMENRRVVEDIEFPVPNPEAAHAFLNAQIGKGYDLSFVLGFLAWRDWSDPDLWACSELAMAAVLAGGRSLSDRHPRMGVRLTREIFRAWSG